MEMLTKGSEMCDLNRVGFHPYPFFDYTLLKYSLLCLVRDREHFYIVGRSKIQNVIQCYFKKGGDKTRRLYKAILTEPHPQVPGSAHRLLFVTVDTSF